MEYSYLTAATTFSNSDNSKSVHFAGGASLDTAADVEALRRLADNLGAAFESPDFESFVDARIAVEDGAARAREVGVHRCILSARSPFFREVFAEREGVLAPARLELWKLVSGFVVGYDALVAVLGYLYSGRVAPLPKELCMCVDEECRHEACRPVVDFMVEVLYASFVFQISELVSIFQVTLSSLLLFPSQGGCGFRWCIEIAVKSDLDIITLEKTMAPDIVKQIIDSRLNLGTVGPESINYSDKHVKRIHGALDNDDVDLVRMLLKEGNTTLDDACALHYAVAYCDSKVTTELLDLELADINHRNIRGYTVLHVAAMRKEPKIIVSLLIEGARPSDLTVDGRKAVQISKRHTKSMEYLKSTEEGQASPKSRLCIEILEQAERRDPQVGEASASLAIAGDDLRGRLLYLENRGDPICFLPNIILLFF
ncbi:hypothetical protein GW17_00000542 [Ensete ventricosum]|nr:hypothetical protein GW17_00000542 [Ensete ventricosum]